MSDLYKFGYTLDETIKTMRDVIDTGNHDRMFLDTYYWLKMLSEYREVGTVEECREAVEKQKAKEIVCENDSVFSNGFSHYRIGRCPMCDRYYNSNDEVNYCSKCGQAIQWDEN